MSEVTTVSLLREIGRGVTLCEVCEESVVEKVYEIIIDGDSFEQYKICGDPDCEEAIRFLAADQPEQKQ